MRIALYRAYYGEDFIRESITSIINHVDAVLIGIADKPWSGIKEIEINGQKIRIPRPIDNLRSIVENMQKDYPGKIHIFDYWQDRPDNQFSNMYNYKASLFNPSMLVIMEPDMVWEKGHAEKVFNFMEKEKMRAFCTFQVEHWKEHKWMIPVRQRPGAIFYNIDLLGCMPQTGKNGIATGVIVPYIKTYIHNYGFCLKIENMWWKHWIGVVNNEYIHDSEPDPSWFDTKWFSWHPEYNNRNLEISRHYKYLIPNAMPYGKRKIHYPGRSLDFNG